MQLPMELSAREMARRRFVPITSSNDAEAPSGDAPHGANGTNRTIQGQAGDNSAPKRARRHTRMTDFWTLTRGEKAPIPLNEFGAPVGDLGGSYCNFLGTIARHSTYCPLNYEQWPDVPIHMKNKIWDDEVLPRCEFIPAPDDYSQIKIWTISNIGEKWRGWKSYIRSTHFDFTKEEDENVEDAKLWLDERGVCLDQYRYLVRYWQSEKGKKASERGKKNRSNGKVPHAAGSKAFRRIAHDMAKKRNGKMPGRALMYCVTHTKKDKNYVNLEASQIAESLQNVIREEEEKLEQDDQDGDAESDTEAGTDPARPWINDGYSKVIGADKGSRVSLMGHLTLSVRKGNPGSKESDSNSNPLAKKLSAYEVKMNDMQKEIDELKAERAHQSSTATQ